MHSPGDELEEKKLSKEQHLAIQAVYAGNGNEYQQKLALDTIVTVLARTAATTYIPGSTEGTAFFAGRQYVGKLLFKIINNPYKEEPANVSKT